MCRSIMSLGKTTHQTWQINHSVIEERQQKQQGNLVGKGGGGLMCVYGVCVCLCLCVCVREGKGFGENLKGRGRHYRRAEVEGGWGAQNKEARNSLSTMNLHFPMDTYFILMQLFITKMHCTILC